LYQINQRHYSSHFELKKQGNYSALLNNIFFET
jgi:hypothetical protein